MQKVPNPAPEPTDNVRMRIFAAASELARERPVDQIRFADVARLAQVHWTTVRRHLGSREDLRQILRAQQEREGCSHSDTRTRILQAADEVFAQRGYAASSLDLVATAAGLSKGAVYWHFASKNDLLIALMERQVADMLRNLPAQVEAVVTATDREQALAGLLSTQFARSARDRSRAMLFYEFVASTRDEAIQAQLRDLQRRALAPAVELIGRLQQEGWLDGKADSVTLALLFRSVHDGLILHWVIDPQGVRPYDRMADFSRLLLRGVGGPATVPQASDTVLRPPDSE